MVLLIGVETTNELLDQDHPLVEAFSNLTDATKFEGRPVVWCAATSSERSSSKGTGPELMMGGCRSNSFRVPKRCRTSCRRIDSSSTAGGFPPCQRTIGPPRGAAPPR